MYGIGVSLDGRKERNRTLHESSPSLVSSLTPKLTSTVG